MAYNVIQRNINACISCFNRMVSGFFQVFEWLGLEISSPEGPADLGTMDEVSHSPGGDGTNESLKWS